MPELTAARARTLLNYDAKEGLLTWKLDRRGKFARKGNEAGSVNSEGYILVGIDGRQYAATRIIHLLVRGYWPDGTMRFADGNPQNLRWYNLLDPTDQGLSPHASYQRTLRRLNHKVTAAIEADEHLWAHYSTTTIKEANRVRHQMRAYIRATDPEFGGTPIEVENPTNDAVP